MRGQVANLAQLKPLLGAGDEAWLFCSVGLNATPDKVMCVLTFLRTMKNPHASPHMSDSETTETRDASPQQLGEVTGMHAPNLDKHNSGPTHTHDANPSSAAQHDELSASGAKLDRPQPTPRRPELPPLARTDERLKRPKMPFRSQRSPALGTPATTGALGGLAAQMWGRSWGCAAITAHSTSG